MTSPERRGLNANNPLQTEKFIQHLQKSWKTSDITNRIKLASSISNTNTMQMTLNEIDQDITKAMLRAERRVRKAKRPPWSPALKQASLLVKYYKLI